MVVLAFLTDPDIVERMLRHLGLPFSAPALAPARSPRPALGFALPDEDSISGDGEDDGGRESAVPKPLSRPPP